MQDVNGHFRRPYHGRTRIFWIVKMEIAYVFVPGRALRLTELRLDDQERRVSLARKNNEVVSLHGPVVRQIKNIVGCARDQSVQIVTVEDFAHTLQFFVVDREAHLATAFSFSSYVHEASLALTSR